MSWEPRGKAKKRLRYTLSKMDRERVLYFLRPLLNGRSLPRDGFLATQPLAYWNGERIHSVDDHIFLEGEVLSVVVTAGRLNVLED